MLQPLYFWERVPRPEASLDMVMNRKKKPVFLGMQFQIFIN
jgi:hypothetical protein